MALTEEQKKAFRAFAIPLFTGAKIDDDRLLSDISQLIRLGLFPNMWQQDRNTQVLFQAQEAKDDGGTKSNCRVPGFENFTNRGYINQRIEDYAKAYPDEAERVLKFLLTWDGKVPDPDKPEENFNLGELRNIREFAKHLVKRERPEWFDRLVNPEVVSIGDLRLISSFNKTTDAQSSFQNSLRGGREFKDTSDLAPHGPWKGPWGEISGYAADMAKTVEKGQSVRDAQKDRLPDIAKELESARKAAKHFKAENAAVQNRTFYFAAVRDDLGEYARLSPNYNPGIQWVVNPFAVLVRKDGQLTPQAPSPGSNLDLYNAIEARINTLERDDLTRRTVEATGRTNRQIAELRELFFRSRDLVDRLSGVTDPERGWAIGWIDTWDNLTEGFALIDLIVTPKSTEQVIETAKTRGDQIVHTIALAKLDLPGKYDLPLLTAVFLFAFTGTLMLVSLVATGNPNWVPMFLIGFVTTFVFHGALKQSASQYSRKSFYGLIGVVFACVVIAVIGGNWHRSTYIIPQLQQEYNDFHRSFTH